MACASSVLLSRERIAQDEEMAYLKFPSGRTRLALGKKTSAVNYAGDVTSKAGKIEQHDLAELEKAGRFESYRATQATRKHGTTRPPWKRRSP